jgi:hypothetical protein
MGAVAATSTAAAATAGPRPKSPGKSIITAQRILPTNRGSVETPPVTPKATFYHAIRLSYYSERRPQDRRCHQGQETQRSVIAEACGKKQRPVGRRGHEKGRPLSPVRKARSRTFNLRRLEGLPIEEGKAELIDIKGLLVRIPVIVIGHSGRR